MDEKETMTMKIEFTLDELYAVRAFSHYGARDEQSEAAFEKIHGAVEEIEEKKRHISLIKPFAEAVFSNCSNVVSMAAAVKIASGMVQAGYRLVKG